MINFNFLILVFLISLYIGSFLNVVGLRSLTGDSFITGRSCCVSCKHQLSLLDMIPLFSWVIYGGKCRYCNEKISYIYPIGELLTACMYTVIIYKYGLTIYAVPHLILASALTIATASDLKEMIVLDEVSVYSFILVLLVRLYIGNVKYYVLGAILSFMVLLAIFYVSKGGMGGADVKIYAPIGLTIGFVNAMRSLMLASISGVVFFIIMKIINNSVKVKNFKLPFVPFINVGVLLTYCLYI